MVSTSIQDLTPPPAPVLSAAFDTPEAKRRYVRRLFATIADRYDLITVLLSFGRDRTWKRRLVALSGAGAGQRAVDLACGTGDLACEMARRGAAVVGLDVTHRMLELAMRKGGPVVFIQGDMLALPLASTTWDVVTTGYGLRNVPDLEAALREIYRVLRPGGTFCALDFNRPGHPAVLALFLGYLTTVGAALGWLLHRDPDTYRYIPASIRRYPGADGVAALMQTAGFVGVRALPVFGGLMAIHVARKPQTE